MNKILSCIIILVLSNNVMAQKFTAATENKEKTTTLFEYGIPINTIEDNFKNLFRNFPLFVSNAGEGLKLISYKHLTAIKDQKEIIFYLTKNVEVYQSGGSILSSFGVNDIGNSKVVMTFLPENQSKRNDVVFLKEISDNIAEMTKYINVGDEVYVVKLFADGKTYDFYLFVDPKTKSVLKKGSLFGFNIPSYYADFHSKRRSK